MANKKSSKTMVKNPYKRSSAHLKLVHSQTNPANTKAAHVQNPNYKITNKEIRKIGHTLMANVPKYRRAG